MIAREIVIFRYRKSLRIGALQEVSGNKVRVAVEKARAFPIPRDNILFSTGVAAGTQGDLDAFRRGVEEMSANLDLREVWDLVLEDSGNYEFRELAELAFSETPDSARYAAMLWHLNSGDCPYFELDDERYVPASAEAVEERRERSKRHERESREDEAFLEWLRGESESLHPEDMSPRQRDRLDRLRSFVVHGDDWNQAPRVKAFLSRMRGIGKNLKRAAFDLLVERGLFEADENLDLHRLAVSIDFTPDAESEAAAFDPSIPAAGGSPRIDFTALEIVSIDDETTTDIDDAFSLTPAESGYRLGVHITDLTPAVKPDSALDETARERVCTLYFPERKIPMLPPILSEGAGSLSEGRERLSLSLLADLDGSFEIEQVSLVPSRIVNRHQLSYETANRILAGEETHALRETLQLAHGIAESFRAKRVAAGAAVIDRADLDIRVDEEGQIDVKVRTTDTAADILVSELMIFYNVEAAKFCRDNTLPIIYRAQDASGYDMNEPVPHPALGRHRFLKAVPPPDLTLEPRPHRLLGAEIYSQFSSPLRRYIDLLLQRQLSSFLVDGSSRHGSEELSMILFQAEERLRELRRLEPDRKRYWLMKHLEPASGETFQGVVLEASDRVGVIELLDYPIRAPVSFHSSAAPGEVLTLRLTRIDPWEGALRFTQA